MPRSREELVEALRELASREWDPDCPETDAPTRVLTEAADLLDSLGEREEYRVVGERPSGEQWGFDGTGHVNRVAVRDSARELAKRNKNVRIQSRTVTETPWTDVEEGTDGC